MSDAASKVVYAALSGHTPLTDLVGTEIHPGHRPQGSGLPSVRYKFVGGRPENVLEGGSAADNQDVQIDAYATDYNTAMTVFEKARDAIEAAGYYLISGPLDFFEEETKLTQYTGDFSIWT